MRTFSPYRHKKRNTSVILLALIIISGLMMFNNHLLASQINKESKFSEAVSHYDARNYDEALKAFLSLVDAGIESYEVHYNIGNTYFRLNQIGKAIVYYKRGLRLKPNDYQLQTNLDFAINQTQDRQETAEPNPLLEIIFNTLNSISLNGWFLLSFISFLPVIAMINIMLIYYRKRDKTVPVFLLVLFLLIFIITISATTYRWQRYIDSSTAVLIASASNGYSGPDSTYTRLFTINEGIVLKVVNKNEDWSQVGLPNGMIGWIKTDDFLLVNPPSS